MAQKVRWKHGSHSVHDFCCNLKRWIVGSSLFLVHVSSRFNMASCTNPQVNYSVPKSWTITYFVPDFTPKKIWCTYPCAGGMPKRARQLSPGLVLDREAGEIDHLGWTDCFSVRGCWEILRNLPLCAWLFIYRILYKVNHTWDACTWIQAMIPVPAVKQSKTKCCRKTKIQKNEYENQCMKRCSNPIFVGLIHLHRLRSIYCSHSLPNWEGSTGRSAMPGRLSEDMLAKLVARLEILGAPKDPWIKHHGHGWAECCLRMTLLVFKLAISYKCYEHMHGPRLLKSKSQKKLPNFMHRSSRLFYNRWSQDWGCSLKLSQKSCPSIDPSGSKEYTGGIRFFRTCPSTDHFET